MPEEQEEYSPPLLQARGHSRPFLGVMFDCCHAYGRLYPDRFGKAFAGRCPRCGRAVSVPIGDDGTDVKFFRA